jgi:hypothetical protein
MPQILYPPAKEAEPSPRLSTVHSIARILRDSVERDEGPLSLAEIGRRLPAKRVRHETLRACVDELKLLGFVTEGSKGVMWTLTTSDEVWRKARVPLR